MTSKRQTNNMAPKGSVLTPKDPWIKLDYGYKRPIGGDHDGCYNLYVSTETEFSVQVVGQGIRIRGMQSMNTLKLYAENLEVMLTMHRTLK